MGWGILCFQKSSVIAVGAGRVERLKPEEQRGEACATVQSPRVVAENKRKMRAL